MIAPPSGTRIWLAAGVTDMRRGMNGLAALVQTTLEQDPFSGHVFIFRGRRGDLVKLLWWSGDGMNLYAKRLERGRFVWPQAQNGSVHLSGAQLSVLLEGKEGCIEVAPPGAAEQELIKTSIRTAGSSMSFFDGTWSYRDQRYGNISISGEGEADKKYKKQLRKKVALKDHRSSHCAIELGRVCDGWSCSAPTRRRSSTWKSPRRAQPWHRWPKNSRVAGLRKAQPDALQELEG